MPAERLLSPMVKLFLKAISTILTFLLIAVGLPLAISNAAFAKATEETEPLEEPSYVTLYSDSSNETEVVLQAASDFPVSETVPMLLYRDGDPVAVESATATNTQWETVSFTVPRPDSGTEDYYVTFGAQVSEMVRIYDSPGSELALTLTAEGNQVFTPEDGPPDLKWTIAGWLPDNKVVYIVEEESGSVVYRSNSWDSRGTYFGQSNDFSAGPARTYKAYVANQSSAWIDDFSQLTDIQATSSELTIQRAPWNVQLSVSAESYTGDEELPVISWSTNQDLSLVQGTYKLYVVDTITGEIVTSADPYDSGSTSGEISDFAEYDQKELNLKGVIALSNEYALTYEELEDIQAESNAVSTVHDSYSISLSMDKSSYQTGEMPVLTWTANQRLNPDYCVAISDSSGEILWYGDSEDSSGRSARVITDRAFFGGLNGTRSTYENEQWTAKLYREKGCAIIEGGVRYDDYTDIYRGTSEINGKLLATSNIAEVEWPQQKLALSVDRSLFSHSDELPTLTAQLNQGIARGQSIVLVNQGTGEIVESNPGPDDLILPEWIYSEEDSTWYIPNDYPSLETLPEGEHPKAGSVVYQYSGWPHGESNYSGESSQTFVAYLTNTDTTENSSGGDDSIYSDFSAKSDPITITREPWTLSASIGVNTECDWKEDPYVNSTSDGCLRDETSTWDSNNPSYVSITVVGNQDIFPITSRESEDFYIVDEKGEVISGELRTVHPNEKGEVLRRDYRPNGIEANSVRAVMVAPLTEGYEIGEPIPEDQIVAFSNPAGVASSVSQAKKWAGGYNPSDANCEQTCLGDPVNTYTGEFFEIQEDLALEGPLPIGFSRSNGSSMSSELGAFGYGWTHNFAMKLNGLAEASDDNPLTVTQENGSVATFYKTVSSFGAGYLPVAGIRAELKEEGGEYLFTRRGENLTYVFDSSGALTRIQDLSGNSLELNYDGAKLLEVRSSTGQSITLGWSNNRITSLSDGERTVSYGYANGQLSTVRSTAIAGTKSYSYDSQKRVTGLTHPNGGSYQNSYDSEGRVIEQTDPLGKKTDFSYSSSEDGKITASTLPDGTVIEDTYDSQGRLTTRSLASDSEESAVYEYSYSPSGQKTMERGPSGTLVRYGYNSAGDLTRLTDALNRTTRFTYDDAGRIVQTVDAAGGIATNSYDSAGRLISNEDPNGNVTQYGLNSNGTVATVTQGSEEDSQITEFGYSDAGFRTTITNPSGGIHTTEFDSLGYPLTRTDELGRSTELGYNSRKQLVSETSPAGATVEYGYDAAGRVTKETDALGRETAYSYDGMDNVVEKTTGYGSTLYTYDDLQRLVRVTYPNGAKNEWTYDSLGRVIEAKDANGATSTRSYDSSGMLSSSVDSLGKETTFSYDAVGNLIQIVGPDGASTEHSYDTLNRLVSTTLADGFVTEYSYDANGNRLSSTRGEVETTSYEYDHRDLLKRTTYADSTSELRSYSADGLLARVMERGGAETIYGYDLAGQPESMTRADGSVATYSYNSDSLLNGISYDGGATLNQSYEYNSAGQLVGETTEAEAISYSYDAMGNVTRRGAPDAPGVSYDYDTTGQLVAISYPSGVELTQSYNADGTLSAIAADGSELIEYGYDSRQNPIKAIYGNETVDSRTYDDYSRLSSTDLQLNRTSLYEKELTYTDTGLLESATSKVDDSTEDSRGYGYDSVRRLESVLADIDNSTYSHDIFSNLLEGPQGSQSYTQDGTLSSRATDSSLTSYSYDLLGNRLSEVSDSDTSNFSWTQNDELASVSGTSDEEDFEVEYSYSANGLLSTRTEDENSSTYVWDTSRPTPTLLEDGDHSFIYGIGVAPFAQIDKRTGDLTYLHGDERESIVAATSESGDLLWSRSYDEYGAHSEFIEHSSSSSNSAFGYAGQYQDSTTGLYNLRARWYDPQTASFLSKDPALLFTGESHAYASGDPLNFTDPLGLYSEGQDLSGVAGFVDGVVGRPLGSQVMSAISPGSIDACSIEYRFHSALGDRAAFLAPGLGYTKIGVSGVKALGSTFGKASSKATPRIYTRIDGGEPIVVAGGTKADRYATKQSVAAQSAAKPVENNDYQIYSLSDELLDRSYDNDETNSRLNELTRKGLNLWDRQH